jgi:hypothetical protein
VVCVVCGVVLVNKASFTRLVAGTI